MSNFILDFLFLCVIINTGGDKMNFLDNLEQLMLNNNIKNISVLSKKSNIPYTTLKNFYSRGTENVGLSTLKKIADFFNVTLDYLVYGEYILKCNKTEFEVIQSFRSLSLDGQRYILQTLDMAKDKYLDETKNSPNEEHITLVAARGDSNKAVVIKKSDVEEDLKNYTPPDDL